MDLPTLLLLLVTIDLTLVAYGVVAARRRFRGRARLVTEGLLVVLPPGLMAGALALSGEAALVFAWRRYFLLMTLSAAGVAIVAEQVARRVDP